MSKPKIIAYLKPSCGWSQGVRAVFKKYDLQYEDRDIINVPENYQEMVERTGQLKQPSVEINGQILADVSGEEIEAWMLSREFETLDAFKGVMSQQHISDPTAYERANYIRILESQK